MKKLILAAFALTTAASVFAQGTIWLENRILGTGGTTVRVYAPLNPMDTVSVVGRSAIDTPPGSTDFGGRLLIGASGLTQQYGGTTTYAQYLMAVGENQPAASLVAVGATTTFRTGSGAGFLSSITSTITAIGATPIEPDYSGSLTVSIVAWDAQTYKFWEGPGGAKEAWLRGEIAAGMMAPFGITSLGGLTPIVHPNQTGQVLTSFNLYFIPEPGSFALLGLGAAAMLIFRRRK